MNTHSEPTATTTTAADLLSIKKIAGFGVALAVILSTQTLYHDALFEASEDIIVGLQTGRSQASFDFWEWVSEHTYGIYVPAILLLLPFISTGRFWYLMIAFQMIEYANSCIFKILYHEPRPTWVFPDVLPVGCSMSFGLPSGHSAESSSFVLVLLLDQLMASKWSRTAHPESNSKTVASARYTFVALLLLFFTYWPTVVFDRIVLGKHTLNQVVLGSLVGFWSASFAHFCLRDVIFHHVNNISNGKMKVSFKDAKEYAKTATLIFLSLFTTAVIVAYLSAYQATIEQAWLVNLTNTCGKHFETDADGNFIVSDKFSQFFDYAIPHAATLAGPLGLYLGSLTFRVKGFGRLDKNAFSSRTGLERVVYALCICGVMTLPDKIHKLN